MAHGSAHGDERDDEPRAAHADSCNPHAPDPRAVHPTAERGDGKSADCRFPRAERTGTSLRAEAAYRPPTEHPFAKSRVRAAEALFEVMQEHDVSNCRLADILGVDEKQVRKYLDGRSHVPLAALALLPSDMASDLYERTVVRGGSPLKRAIAALRRARDLRAVHDAQRELLELAAELSR